MPTQKDIEFAKLLASKDLISKAEMQRLLDELDDLRKKDPRISVEVFMIKNKVITNHELKIIKESSKQRIVHCSKCRTMYRVSQDDVGKRFKCKTCGTAVIVPMPGQTKSKSVRDLVHKEKKAAELDSRKVLKSVSKEEYQNKQETASNPEVTIDLDEDDEVDVPVTASASTIEATINLGLDDEDDSQGIFINEGVHLNIPQMENPEVTINLGGDDEDDEDDLPRFVGNEATINLGLDDSEDNGILITSEAGDQNPEMTMNLEDYGNDFSEDDSNPQLAVETTVQQPAASRQEMTINLGLDDADAEDDSDVQLIVDNPGISIPSRQVGSQEMTMPVHGDSSYDDDDSDAELLVDEIDVSQATMSAGREMTINLGLDDGDADDDSDAELVVDTGISIPSRQVAAHQEMTMPVHSSSTYDEDDSDAELLIDEIDISQATMAPMQNTQPPAGREMTINLGLDDGDADEDSDAELVVDTGISIPSRQVAAHQEMTMPVHSSSTHNEDDSDAELLIDEIDVSQANMAPMQNTQPPVGREMTINLGLDDPDNDDEDSDAELIVDSPKVSIPNRQVAAHQEMTMPVHSNSTYDDDDSDAELLIDEIDVSEATMSPMTNTKPPAGREMTINLGLDEVDDDDEDSDAQLVIDNSISIPSRQVAAHQEMTIQIDGDDDYDDEDSDAELLARKPKPKKNPELTIDLGLDDDDDYD